MEEGDQKSGWGRRKGGHRNWSSPKLWIAFFICLFVVLQEHNGFVAGQDTEGKIKEKVGVDAKELKKRMEELGNANMEKFNYKDLVKWYEEQKPDTESVTTHFSFPRLFPFCVTYRQMNQGQTEEHAPGVNANPNDPILVHHGSHLFQFRRYIHYYETAGRKYHEFNKAEKKDITTLRKDWVKDFKLSRINTPEKDMVNLRQWVHITITMTEKVQGLLLQSIVGPFGLPFGEFSVEFPCKDVAESGNRKIAEIGQIAYCSHRPRTSLYHPSMYVGYAPTNRDDDTQSGTDEFHVHFKWHDLDCNEMPYVQFIMLIVKNFSKHDNIDHAGEDDVALLSPVFLNKVPDSPDAYPYWPGWKDNMHCNIKDNNDLHRVYPAFPASPKPGADGNYAPIPIQVSNEEDQIIPNQEYDDCILYDGKDPTVPKPDGFDEFQCPPGPFRCCPSSLENGTRDDDWKDELIKKKDPILSVTTKDECALCAPPPCEQIFPEQACKDAIYTQLEVVKYLDSETNVLTNLDDNTIYRAHGVAGMLCFLFFIPLGNLVARFYKEIMRKCLFGNGPWVTIHLLCSVFALAAIWESMSQLVPSFATYRSHRRTCERLWNSSVSDEFKKCMEPFHVKTLHSATGFGAFILLHLVPICGFIRPSSNKMRFIMSVIHSHLGYFVFFLGAFSIFQAVISNPRCGDTLVFAAILIVFPILFTIILVVLDCIIDKRLGVKPGRSQWPVLEELEMDGRGPFEIVKLSLLLLFIILQGTAWAMALISLHVVNDSGDELIKGANDFKGDKANVLKGLQGIFYDC